MQPSCSRHNTNECRTADSISQSRRQAVTDRWRRSVGGERGSSMERFNASRMVTQSTSPPMRRSMCTTSCWRCNCARHTPASLAVSLQLFAHPEERQRLPVWIKSSENALRPDSICGPAKTSNRDGIGREALCQTDNFVTLRVQRRKDATNTQPRVYDSETEERPSHESP